MVSWKNKFWSTRLNHGYCQLQEDRSGVAVVSVPGYVSTAYPLTI